MKFDYEKQPDAIYAQSFGIVESEAGAALDRLPSAARAIAVRMTHACGEPAIAGNIVVPDDFVGIDRTAMLVDGVNAHMRVQSQANGQTIGQRQTERERERERQRCADTRA